MATQLLVYSLDIAIVVAVNFSVTDLKSFGLIQNAEHMGIG